MQPTVLKPMDMTIAEALLHEAKQILNQLRLVFFLRHGTCLGAVRDNAFIAWDDDLDIGSVIGLYGLTEERVRSAADVFKEQGFDANITENELNLSVDLKKSGTQMDWTCYMPSGMRSDDRPRLVSAIGACDGWSARVECQPDTSVWNTAR